ncbi:MAG: hypothetical protein M1825_005381 [Sarcosagium campestre]|nr:MAG: hypothetical protein M1825_005381 [Sarcosagium campestre]
MSSAIQDRLLRRELGSTSRHSSVAGLYGDRSWVQNLDIVNELGGHSGCVNALSWSRSGRLLASGSDDQRLNIHTYQPESSTAPFSLTTSVYTGHSANIFSVKFMPHSEDRTLVTCAGDGEVRIFDLEHSARSRIPSQSTSSRRSARIDQATSSAYNGIRYLSEGDTNARTYRSHSDRVKRVVTESSPYLFLTCSEDGEVRQWDLRQPSSYYPAPRGRRGFLGTRVAHEAESSHVPPPLISYKRYNLDLNSISCSSSQPHYIALGGAHLHCFLHDRRMLGRDVQVERGTPSSDRHGLSTYDEQMGQATRCVRKFAPNGTKKMKRTDSGHITACKISDANPNEMIVSWSGEWIYSFDLVRSPDADDEIEDRSEPMAKSAPRVRRSRDRKRKRESRGSGGSQSGGSRGGSRPRQEADDPRVSGDLALRVRYENGQSEDISIDPTIPATVDSSDPVIRARESMLDQAQRRSFRIARSVVRLRKELFGLESTSVSTDGTLATYDADLRTSSFTCALGLAATHLPTVDAVIRTWRYPVNPSEEDIIFQSTLRGNREAARRFIQAAGTLSRVLGGRLQTSGPGASPALQYFQRVEPAPSEGDSIDLRTQFNYDFLKAILVWLESGREGLLEAFIRPPTQRRHSPRFPVPAGADSSAIDDILIPYLLRLAGPRSINNADTSRFEVDDHRVLFQSESAAVVAFGNAIKHLLVDDSSPASEHPTQTEDTQGGATTQSRNVAIRFWGVKVARGLLMNAGEGITFAFVDRAFGGLGTQRNDEGRSQEDIDAESDDEFAELLRQSLRGTREEGLLTSNESVPATVEGASSTDADAGLGGSSSSHIAPSLEHEIDEGILFLEDLHDAIADRLQSEDEDQMHDSNADEDDDEVDNDDDDDSDEDEDEEGRGDLTSEDRFFMFSSAYDRSMVREKVEQHVPCSSHTRSYRGHCNVKTVKDVNFYGLQDEYVVSGSDSGHLFIWDKHTTTLLNILEGDGEVVNVVQGHPYEPILAVSGIDHTIKIFSPDARLQADARAGINLSTRGNSGYSTLDIGRRVRLGRPRQSSPSSQTQARSAAGEDDDNNNDEDDEDDFALGEGGLESRRRMHQSYQITSQNDVERRGGMRDAYITVRLPRVRVGFGEWSRWFG